MAITKIKAFEKTDKPKPSKITKATDLIKPLFKFCAKKSPHEIIIRALVFFSYLYFCSVGNARMAIVATAGLFSIILALFFFVYWWRRDAFWQQI